MKKIFCVLLFVLIILVGETNNCVKAEKNKKGEMFYGVLLKETNKKNIKEIKKEIGKIYKVKHKFSDIKVLTVKTSDNLETVQEKLKSYGQVEILNAKYKLFSEQNNWNLQLTKIDSARNNLGLNGSGYTVAVLDVGIDGNIPELKEKMKNKYDCTLNIKCTEIPLNSDENGFHGTKVAGLISTESYGVAPGSKIIDFDLNANEIDDVPNENVYNALDKVKELLENGEKIDVINMSFGSNEYDVIMESILSDLASKGVILVAATGNDGDINDDVMYPAGFDTVTAVGSVDNNKQLAVDSSYGNHVSLVAPGVSVETFDRVEGVKSVSGTSYAAPQVAGIATLYKQNYPSFSSYEIIDMLYENAEDRGDTGKDKYYGYGLVNAIPPKHYVINKEINVNGNYKIYEIPNTNYLITEKVIDHPLIVTRAKGWNEEKRRFDWYFSTLGWIKADDSMDGIEKNRKIIDFNTDSLILYNSPSQNDPYKTVVINPNRIRTQITEEIKVVDNKEWFMVNLPEYGITNKWMISKQIYASGLMDDVSGRSVVEHNVYDGRNLIDNSLNGYTQFNAGGYIEYRFEKPVNINKFYTNMDEQYVDDNLNLNVELLDINQSVIDQFSINKDNINKYIEIDKEIQNVYGYRIKNDGTNNKNIKELELFGEYSDIAEPAKDLSYQFKFSGKYYTFYDNATTKENPLWKDVKGMTGTVSKGFFWNEVKKGFRWYKVSVPEAGIKDKWVEVNDNEGSNIYTQGLMDNVAGRSVIEHNVYDGRVYNDNSLNGYTQLQPNGYYEYRFEKPVSVDKFFVEKLDKRLNPDAKLELELLDEKEGTIKKISINDDSYFRVINNIEAQSSVYGYRIKNIGSTTSYIREFELFGSFEERAATPMDIDFTFNFDNDKHIFYDNINTRENPVNKDVNQMKGIATQGFYWVEEKKGFKYYKVSVPDAGIEDEWVEVNGNEGSNIYTQGLIDNVAGRSVIEHNLYDGRNFNDNSLNGYTQLQPNGYYEYRFEKPVKVDKLYIEKLDKRLNPDAHLKLELLDYNQTVIYTKMLEKDDYFTQIVELESTENVSKYKITNVGSSTEYIREYEMFGSFGDTAFEPIVIDQSFTFNSKNYTFYDDYKSKSNRETKDVYQQSAVVSEGYYWEEEKKGFRWYKVSVPAANIENKWVQVNYNDGNNIYNKGILDSVTNSLVTKNDVYSEYNLFDNSQNGYVQIYANGNIEYKFNNPINVNSFYLEKLDKRLNPDAKIVLELLDQQGGQIKQITLTEDEYFKEINVLESDVTGVYGFKMKNSGSSTENIREIELFGSTVQ